MQLDAPALKIDRHPDGATTNTRAGFTLTNLAAGSRQHRQPVREQIGMHTFFIDDSVQRTPTRPKAGALVAVGGICIPNEGIAETERRIEDKCREFGFPDGQIFKWSPGKEHWMRTGLIDERRREFFVSVLEIAKAAGARAVFACVDKNCSCAEKSSSSHEEDVVKLLIERIDWYFRKNHTSGFVIVDRQSGDMKDEERFLARCLETLRSGTSFLKPTTIVMTFLSSPSRFSRLLQLADLVTASTLARVSGETRWSPNMVEAMLPIYASESGRIGGVGVKLHPWKKYGNLYHWVFKDSHYWTGNSGYPMPISNIAFSKNGEEY